ncbi:MAG: hypothetical protein H6773_02020 [Pseudomonadales bacterium]|nr:hypothetical protein [Candidatus Woesebacteria bacterium]MCB9800934.1 hypothetical protein [Pseudomonadales bacterium]
MNEANIPRPKVTKLNFTYKRDDTDLWVLNTDDLPIRKDLIKDQQIIQFAPKSFGGNHSHQRIEWFIGIGDLTLIWVDQNGKKHTQNMSSKENVLLFEIPPHLPHAVLNNSETDIAVLFEFADQKMSNTKQVEIITN